MLRIFFTSFLVVNFARGDRPHTFENLLHIALVRRTLSGILHFNNWMMIWLGSNGGVVMRAIPSHQCGPGPIPRVDAYMGWVCCWFSPLLQEVFLWVLRFSPLLKNQHFQFPIWPGIEEPLCGCATSKSLFILFIFLYFEVYTISEYNEQWVALLSMHPLNISRTDTGFGYLSRLW